MGADGRLETTLECNISMIKLVAFIKVSSKNAS